MEPIYKKIGKRYKQIGVYDDESYYLTKGAWLTVIDDGFRSTRKILKLDTASVLASLKGFENELTAAIVRASALRPPSNKMLTSEQKKAHDAYVATLGDDGLYFSEYPSIYECVSSALQLAIDKVTKEAENANPQTK